MGEAGLEAMRKIVAEKNAAKINECFIDLFSASAVVKVYDAVNEKNRARLLALPVGRVCEISLSVLTNQKG
jgi:hypothetical protein